MSRAFSLLFKRMGVFLPFGAICWILVVAINVFSGSSMATFSQAMNQQGTYNNSDFMNELLGSLLGAFVGQFMVAQFLFTKCPIVYAVVALYAQQQPTFVQSLKQGCSCFCDLSVTGTALVFASLICQLFISVIAFGIMSISDSLAVLALIIQLVYSCFWCYVMVSFMILTPVIIVEGKSTEGIWRCMQLADGKRWFIFCSVFCIVVINIITQMILAQILFATHKDGQNVAITAPILYNTFTTLPTILYLPLINM